MTRKFSYHPLLRKSYFLSKILQSIIDIIVIIIYINIMKTYIFHTTQGTIRIEGPRLDRAVRILIANYPEVKFTSWYYHIVSNELYSSRILSPSYLKQVGWIER